MAQDNGCGTWILIGIIAFGLYQCTKSKPDSAVYAAGDQGFMQPFDVDAAHEVAEEEAEDTYSSMSYQDAGAPYGCTQDCSGHDAGWQWAIENGASDVSDCYGSSSSFIEGCWAYVESVQSAAEAAVADAEDAHGDF